MYHDMPFFSMYHFVIVYYHKLAFLFVLLNLIKVAWSCRMVVEFTSTYAISANHRLSCKFESRSSLDVLDSALYDKVCQ